MSGAWFDRLIGRKAAARRDRAARQVVGFAGAAPFRQETWLRRLPRVSLYVDRAWRSRGVGRQLGHGSCTQPGR